MCPSSQTSFVLYSVFFNNLRFKICIILRPRNMFCRRPNTSVYAPQPNFSSNFITFQLIHTTHQINVQTSTSAVCFYFNMHVRTTLTERFKAIHSILQVIQGNLYGDSLPLNSNDLHFSDFCSDHPSQIDWHQSTPPNLHYYVKFSILDYSDF